MDESDTDFLTSLNLVSTQLDDPIHGQGTSCKEDVVYGSTVVEGPFVDITTDGARNCALPESQTFSMLNIISRIQAEDNVYNDHDTECGNVPFASISETTLKSSTAPVDASDDLNECDLTDDNDDADQSCLHCSICCCDFSRRSNLIHHLMSVKHRQNINESNLKQAAALYTKFHTDLLRQSSFQCSCCSFSPIDHSGLVAHMKSQQHTESVSKLVGPLECSNCGFLDYQGDQMLAHCLSADHIRKSKTGCCIKERRSKIRCNICGSVLHSTLHYSRHLKHQHEREISTATQCRYCRFEGTATAVSQHTLRSHVNDRKFTCDVCNQSFNFLYDLKKHYNSLKHIDRVLESYSHEIKYTTTHAPHIGPLIASDRDRGSSKVPNMKCKFCPFVTPNLSQLQRHYVSHHEETYVMVEDTVPASRASKVKVCRFCSCTVEAQLLISHEIKHVLALIEQRKNGEEQRCFICYDAVPHELMESHLSLHNNRKPVQPNASKTRESTASTSRISHHSCSHAGCSRSYKTKADLNIHMRTHLESPHFLCEVCEKAFPTRKQLKAHSLTHQALAMYHCDYCSYRSKTKCHLDRHMRIHAGSRPYSCPYCQYSSTTIGNLRKHVLKTSKHKELPMYECTEDGCTYTANSSRKVTEHLSSCHRIHGECVKVKSTENDWTDVMEGHPIIHVQRSDIL